MELFFIALIGLAIGLAVFVALPKRALLGVALLPLAGTVIASVVWVGLSWLGFVAAMPFSLRYNGGWIWVITIVATVVLTAAIGMSLIRSREKADAELYRSFGGRRLAPAK